MYGRSAELIVLIGLAASGTYADCEENGKQLDKVQAKTVLVNVLLTCHSGV